MGLVTQVVTIGRNIGDQPMPDDHWQAFKSAVNAALADCCGNVIQRPRDNTLGDQQGTWEGKVCEEAATFVALTPQRYAYTVRPELARIASRFQQEAIGFIVVDGGEHLVRPFKALPYGAETPDGFIVGV